MEVFDLYNKGEKNSPKITFYPSFSGGSKGAVIIFAGGGYLNRSIHEDKGYAQFINGLGINAFVVDYSVVPKRFPCQLLDARRAVRFVRHNAEKFSVDSKKIGVMGSSAGGHLCALLCTYRGTIEGEINDEIDREDYLPNFQILCYPVISCDEKISHIDSYKNLLGCKYDEREKYSPDLIADETTPKAFIWHTFEDETVNVINSLKYVERLREKNVSCELHVFPHAPHGEGLANTYRYLNSWTVLLRNWLIENDIFDRMFGY